MNQENLYTPNCIRTFSGAYMNVFEPTKEMVCIEDVAHALAYQCRFGGHLPVYYSVAQHCVLMSEMAPEDQKLSALLHDASEAYLLDIPRPIKKNLSDYGNIEDSLMTLLSEKFGFNWPLHESVKVLDDQMLQWEWSALMLRQDESFECWPPQVAEERFLVAFRNLVK